MRPRVGTWVLGAVGAVVATGNAEADPIDPTAPPRFVVGTPAGLSPMHRIDAEGRGQSRSALPLTPRVSWRLRLEGEAVGAPAVNTAGRAIVASTDRRVTQVDPSGKVEWQVDLSGSPAAGAVLTSDGLVAVVGEDGVLVGITKEGRVVRRTALGVLGPLRAPPLPTDRGGLLVALGAELLELGPLGDIRLRVTAPARIAALVQHRGATLVTTETGLVFSLHATGRLRPAGDLGGRLTGAFLQLTPQSVVAVVQATTLVQLDLDRGTRRVLFNVAPDAFADLVATSTPGTLRSVTRTGQLLQHDASGALPLGGPLPLSPGRTEADSQALLVDARGTTAVLGREALAVIPVGSDTRLLPLGGCDALALSPAGAGRLVITCRAGLVLGVADTPQ